MAKQNNNVGEFGEQFTQFRYKPKEAIKHLKRVKHGECISALYRNEIGDIDIVWGENDPKTNKGYGLKHIIEKHGAEIKRLGFEVEDFIPIVVQFGEFSVKKSDTKKVVFESEFFRFVVQTSWNCKKKNFLLCKSSAISEAISLLCILFS